MIGLINTSLLFEKSCQRIRTSRYLSLSSREWRRRRRRLLLLLLLSNLSGLLLRLILILLLLLLLLPLLLLLLPFDPILELEDDFDDERVGRGVGLLVG